MLNLLLIAIVSAAASPRTVAILDFETAGVSTELAATAGLLAPDELRQRLTGARIISGNDVRTMITSERQRELLGCADTAQSCIAELAGALGSDELVAGKLGRLGGSIVVEMRRLKSTTGTVVKSGTRTVQREEDIAEAIRSIVLDLYPPPAPTLRSRAWLPAVVGVAAAGGGSFLLFQARAAHDQLRAAERPTTGATGEQLRDGGARDQLVGSVLLGAAGTAFATAGVMYILGDGDGDGGGGGDAPTEARVALSGTGMTLEVTF